MNSGRPSAFELGRREAVLAALGAIALAIVMTWPLAAHLDSRIAADLGDPVRTAWQVAWEGHALLHRSTAFFTTNAFWPLPDNLAFSDSLLGYAPAGLIGKGVTAAVLRYNLLFLFAYALSFIGTYLLARELGVGKIGAVVAGVAFAYAPFRATMNGHLHVISSGAIPLSLFFLVRGYRRESWPLIAAGWLVAAWQLSLGFTLGLQLVYLLAVLAVVVAVLWWRRGRPRPPRGVVIATAAGCLAFAAVGVLEAQPYLQVGREYPSAERTESEVRHFSAPPRAFLAAPYQSRVWGKPLAPVRNELPSRNESTLFPGLTIVVLAVVGVAAGGAFPRRLRVGMAVGVIVVAVLSLGFGVFDGDFTYRPLYDHAPGWNAVRTPGRLNTLTSLGLALLGAAGAAYLVTLAGRRGGKRSPRAAAIATGATGAVLVALLLVEGAGRVGDPRVPAFPPAQRLARPPQLHLPTNGSFDRIYQLWSVDGFPYIVNGVSTFDLPSLDRVRGTMRTFPDAGSIRFLRDKKVRTVVLHTDLPRSKLPPAGSPPLPDDPKAGAAKPVAGLPVRRRAYPGVVIYDILPVPQDHRHG